MATSGTDILFFAMLAGGGILVAMNWKCLSDGTFCGLGGNPCVGTGGCTGTGGCINGYIKTSSGCLCTKALKNCPAGMSILGLNQVPPKCICTTCNNQPCQAGFHGVPTASGAGCDCIKNTGGGGGCTPVGTGNCTYDCKGHFCWRSTANTPSGPKAFQQCNTNSAGANSNIAQSCATVRANFCVLHSRDGKCGTGGCPAGKVLGPNGNCIATNVSDCPIGAKQWLARNANAMLGRMTTIAGRSKVPTGDRIVSTYPSILKTMSVLNACTTTKLHINSAAWCKQYAQLLWSIAGSYGVPLISSAQTSLSQQMQDGLWRLGPWLGAGVQTFYGQSNPNPFQDNRPGDSYARALEGRYNRWNPFGDNRYAYTLPTSMKVQVS